MVKGEQNCRGKSRLVLTDANLMHATDFEYLADAKITCHFDRSGEIGVIVMEKGLHELILKFDSYSTNQINKNKY